MFRKVALVLPVEPEAPLPLLPLLPVVGVVGVRFGKLIVGPLFPEVAPSPCACAVDSRKVPLEGFPPSAGLIG